jgi:APA family basic amino acid/polyamine antiporter
MEGKKSKLTIPLLMGIGLTTIIGFGIWKDPIIWVNDTSIYTLLATTITWILVFTVGLSYSECVSMFPKSGGAFSFVGGAFGNRAGTIAALGFNFSYMIVSSLLSYITALFLLAAFGLPTTTGNVLIATFVTLLIICGLSGINSSRFFAWTASIWVVMKVVMLLIIVILIFIRWDQAIISQSITLNDFQLTMRNSIWSLFGVEVILVFAGEAKKVEKNIPKAILFSLVAVILIYFVVIIALSGLIHYNSLTTSNPIQLLELLANSVGINQSVIYGFVGFASFGTAYSTCTAQIYQNKILAEEKILPEILGKSIKKHLFFGASLIFAIELTIAIILIVTQDVWPGALDNWFAVATALNLLSIVLPAGLTALYLRIKHPVYKRPFKAPAYFIVFPLNIILALVMLVLNFLDITELWPAIIVSIFFIVIAVLLAYYYSDNKKTNEKQTNEQPDI